MTQKIITFFYAYRKPFGLALVGALYIAFVTLTGLT